MRQHESVRHDDAVAGRDQVDVEGTWGDGAVPDPAGRVLQRQPAPQQVVGIGVVRSVEDGDHVEVVRMSDHTPRFGLVDGRHGHEPQIAGGQRGDRPAERRLPVTQVRAQRIDHSHVAASSSATRRVTVTLTPEARAGFAALGLCTVTRTAR